MHLAGANHTSTVRIPQTFLSLLRNFILNPRIKGVRFRSLGDSKWWIDPWKS